jgi:cell division protein FtsL
MSLELIATITIFIVTNIISLVAVFFKFSNRITKLESELNNTSECCSNISDMKQDVHTLVTLSKIWMKDKHISD